MDLSPFEVERSSSQTRDVAGSMVGLKSEPASGPSTSSTNLTTSRLTGSSPHTGKKRRHSRQSSSSSSSSAYSDSSKSGGGADGSTGRRPTKKCRLSRGRFKRRKGLRKDRKKPLPPPPPQSMELMQLHDAFSLVVPDISRPTYWQFVDFYDSIADCDEQTLSRLYVEARDRLIEEKFLKIFLSCTYKPPVEKDRVCARQKKCPQRYCVIVDSATSSDRCRLFETRIGHNHPHVECPVEERKRRIVIERSRREKNNRARQSTPTPSPDSDSELSAVADEAVMRPKSPTRFKLRDYFAEMEAMADQAGVGFNPLIDSCMFFTKKAHVEAEKLWFEESIEKVLRRGNQLRLTDYGRKVWVAEYEKGVWKRPEHDSHARWPKGTDWGGFAARLRNKISELFDP